MPSPYLERSLKISNLCQDILSVNTETRCSSFINKNGRIIESKFRDDGNITGLTKQDLEMLGMQCKLQSSMNNEFSDKLGHLDYTLICREYTFDFLFPFYDGIIFVSVTRNTSIHNTSKQILELITIFELNSGIKNLR